MMGSAIEFFVSRFVLVDLAICGVTAEKKAVETKVVCKGCSNKNIPLGKLLYLQLYRGGFRPYMRGSQKRFEPNLTYSTIAVFVNAQFIVISEFMDACKTESSDSSYSHSLIVYLSSSY